MSQYTPEEIKVKVVGDQLEISAKHSEKPDEHGYISREFTRQFLIPEVSNKQFIFVIFIA